MKLRFVRLGECTLRPAFFLLPFAWLFKRSLAAQKNGSDRGAREEAGLEQHCELKIDIFVKRAFECVPPGNCLN